MDKKQPATLQELETPCFVVNIDIVQENCRRMSQRSKDMGVNLRPHMKTHKTIELAKLMTNNTKCCITVSTVTEAEFFADAGFEDILYAAIFSFDKLPRLKKLVDRLKEFHVLIDNEEGLKTLGDQRPIGKKWSVFMKIDVGYHRAGVIWDSEGCVELAKKINNSGYASLKGIYTHDGTSYDVQGIDELKRVGNEAAQRLLDVSSRIKAAGIENLVVATGSTPSCSQPGDMIKLLSEIHPGNYVFYDIEQSMVGACKVSDIAGRVATRVTSHYPKRNQMIVDAGFTALSHDRGSLPHTTMPHEGLCIIEGHPELSYIRMTQEVGIIEPVDSKFDFSAHPIGSMLYLLPFHSCATAAMHPHYYLHSGEKITDIIKPCRGW